MGQGDEIEALTEMVPQSLPPLYHRTALEMLAFRAELLLSHAEEAGNPSPDVSNLRPVLQEPAVRRLVLPAGVAGVLPQQFDLVCGVPSVPEGVAQVLTWACFGLHCLTWRRVVECG